MIDLHYIDVKEVPGLDSEFLFLWLNDVILEERHACGEINLIFCSDEHLLKVNKTYLNHDYYTDIVTFDYCEDDLINGDLFISIDRVQENAPKFNASFLSELRRVCVHGVLHLCGYGDKSPEEESMMRTKEQFYLNKYVSRETSS